MPLGDFFQTPSDPDGRPHPLCGFKHPVLLNLRSISTE